MAGSTIILESPKLLTEKTVANEIKQKKKKPYEQQSFWQRVVWVNTLIHLYINLAALYGFYMVFTGNAKARTLVFAYLYAYIGEMGIVVGAHRLWAHKAYKATWQAKTIIMFLASMNFQNSVYVWVRDHRVHHKYADTDADPHNINRGFFFSHMGWLMMKKHPDVIAKGKTIDLSDMESDPFVMWQHKYIFYMLPFTFLIPALIPYYCWGETFANSWHIGSIIRYAISLHCIWCINSLCHTFGIKSYDKSFKACDNPVMKYFGGGEGFHNYHHVFPWDYRSAEMGQFKYNQGKHFIDLLAKYGWAYDLRTASTELIQKRAARTGDGTNLNSNCIPDNNNLKTTEQKKSDLNHYHYHHHNHGNNIWGWDDSDLSVEDKNDALIINKTDD